MGKLLGRHPALGIALGVLSGMLLPFTLGLAPVLMLSTVIVALLGVWSGLVAALAASVVHLVVAFEMGGAMLFLLVLEAMLLPAWGVIVLISRRPLFFEGVKWSAIMSLGALFMLVVCAWLVVRGDLIDYFMKQMGAMVDALGQEIIGMALGAWGQAGLFGTSTGIDFSRALTSAEQAQLTSDIARMLTGYLQLNFAGLLLTGGVTTGAVSYWLSARVLSRRGDEPTVDYRHVYEWRLSKSLIIGPSACALVCYIAYSLGLSGADAAFQAFMSLSLVLFAVQGLGAIDRRIHASGAPGGYRAFTLCFLVVVGAYLLRIVGVLSALFGKNGLITEYIKRRAGQNGKGDDDE